MGEEFYVGIDRVSDFTVCVKTDIYGQIRMNINAGLHSVKDSTGVG